MNSFLISNLSGFSIVIISLDNFSLGPAVAAVDMMLPVNGGFAMDDIANNPEIQTLLDNGDISATDGFGGVINSVGLVFGKMPITINPPVITANKNDYSPVGWDGAYIVNIDLLGVKSITGFKAGKDCDRKIIRNISNYELKLSPNSTSSLLSNRIDTPEHANFKIKRFSSVEVIYNAITNKWQPIHSKKT